MSRDGYETREEGPDRSFSIGMVYCHCGTRSSSPNRPLHWTYCPAAERRSAWVVAGWPKSSRCSIRVGLIVARAPVGVPKLSGVAGRPTPWLLTEGVSALGLFPREARSFRCSSAGTARRRPVVPPSRVTAGMPRN